MKWTNSCEEKRNLGNVLKDGSKKKTIKRGLNSGNARGATDRTDTWPEIVILSYVTSDAA